MNNEKEMNKSFYIDLNVHYDNSLDMREYLINILYDFINQCKTFKEIKINELNSKIATENFSWDIIWYTKNYNCKILYNDYLISNNVSNKIRNGNLILYPNRLYDFCIIEDENGKRHILIIRNKWESVVEITKERVMTQILIEFYKAIVLNKN